MRRLPYILVVLLTIGLFPTPAPAQWLPRGLRALFVPQEGQELLALEMAERQFEQNPEAPGARDMLATVRSMVGDYAGAQELMNERRQFRDLAEVTPEWQSRLAAARRLDAVEAIVAAAQDRQVVILNEAHHVPETRHLTLEVARRLRPLGFRYLACEAFLPEIKNYGARGYPTRETCGGYVSEPVFADLVRQADRLGYELVPYEFLSLSSSPDPVDDIAARETGQAQLLVERIFRKDPEARVLIHCGYEHATEAPSQLGDGRSLAWMAGRLAAALHIDPLTIDQTRQRQMEPREQSGPLWRYVVDKEWVPRPTVFLEADGKSIIEGRTWEGRVDLQVFHPAVTYEYGRPVWLQMNGYRKPVPLPAEFEPREGRILVQALLHGEDEDALAMDQILWSAGDPPPTLMLPAGRYRIIAQDQGRDRLLQAEQIVK